MDNRLSLATMLSACEFVKSEYNNRASLSAIGLLPNDLERLVQDGLWSVKDRLQVQRAMTALRDGLADAQGFPPFQVPAEYQAALIAAFVKPANVRCACSWLASATIPANDTAAGAQRGSSEPVQADQLFALFLQARVQDSGFAAVLESKVQKAIQKAAADPVIPQGE